MSTQRPTSTGPSANGPSPAGGALAPALNVGFLLTDNFTLSAFSLMVDQFRLAADDGDRSRPIRARWQVMSAKADAIRASCGVTVSPSGPLGDPAAFDYIIVVGGLLHGGQHMDEETVAFLKRAARAGVSLVGVCTGSFVLARAGLMTGRRCCVSWYHYQDFLEEFPHHTPVADRLYVIDGDRITCAGGGGAADLATALVEKSMGRSVAQKGRHILQLDRQRPGSESQPHPPIADLVADDRVRRALLLMEQHLADPLPIADIARRLQLSTRQLERLFQTVMGQRPAEFYRRLRLRYARFLLDTTGRSVTDIALEAGFSDCAHFSRQFKAQHGFTPSDARAQSPGPMARNLAAQRLFD
ncbi:transcriptional regulator GlxA family with amidase domain [Angulomicrobium tetraedrale]|uniref:Transcriptional regulator GlxA family with amidase domain n=1 Tax=Ancylobacter tetraedralis TaxID=217068 RepID=A0A839ZCC0_9HYPH|nr:GlxA family transcriptional regulator [Ancylobacter tetraedralis]MBB3772368.1 transcriptional regulator GlxA family with amidase domain [Ancylobacter tetraedralis]